MSKTFLPALMLMLFLPGFAYSQTGQNIPCISYRLVGYVIIPVRDHPENFEVRLLSKLGERPIGYSNVDLSGRYEFTELHQLSEMDLVVRLDGFKELREAVRIPEMIATYNNGVLVLPSLNCVHQMNVFLTPNDPTVAVDERLKGYPKEAIDEYVLAIGANTDKHFEDVVKHLEKVVQLAADWFDAHCELGAAYEEIHRFDDAEMQYRTALELKPDGLRPVISLGRLLLAEADDKIQAATPKDLVKPMLNQAHEVLTSAVKLDPKSAMALYMLGVVDFRLASYSDAENELKLALTLDATMYPARIALINVYIEQKKWDTALDNIDEFLLDNPASPYLQQMSATRASVVRRVQAGLH